MPLGRRVSKDVAEPMEADRVLADGYRDRLAEATEAEQALREAQAEDPSGAAPGERARAFDRALTAAKEAAEAAERLAAGPAVYVPAGADAAARRAAEIAFRKARATPKVKPWTGEVDRLRTAREEHRMSFRARPATVGGAAG